VPPACILSAAQLGRCLGRNRGCGRGWRIGRSRGCGWSGPTVAAAGTAAGGFAARGATLATAGPAACATSRATPCRWMRCKTELPIAGGVCREVSDNRRKENKVWCSTSGDVDVLNIGLTLGAEGNSTRRHGLKTPM
jgi:hypothetical protein